LAVSSRPCRLPQICALLLVGYSAWFTWAKSSFFPTVAQPWPLDAVVQKAAQSRNPYSDPLSVLTVLSNHEFMNSNNIRWTVKKQGLERQLVARGKAEKLGQLAEFVLVKTGSLGPAGSTDRQEKLRQEALNPQGWFQKAFQPVGQWDLPDGKATLYQRLGSGDSVPITLDPVRALPRLVSGVGFRKLETFTGLSARFSSEAAVVASADEVFLKGLRLADARWTLDGLWAVQDDAGLPRLLRLRRVEIKTMRLREEVAMEWLAQKAKSFKDSSVAFLPDNRVEISGLLGPARVRAAAKLQYRADPPALLLQVERLQLGGVSLPSRWLQKTFPLSPSGSTPFFATFSGLRTVPKDSRAPGDPPSGYLEIAP
jgi:hypothetical protein